MILAETSNNPGEVPAGHLRPTAAMSKNLEKSDALFRNPKHSRVAAFCSMKANIKWSAVDANDIGTTVKREIPYHLLCLALCDYSHPINHSCFI